MSGDLGIGAGNIGARRRDGIRRWVRVDRPGKRIGMGKFCFDEERFDVVRFRVDDCYLPVGGDGLLGKLLLNAQWQFRICPPFNPKWWLYVITQCQPGRSQVVELLGIEWNAIELEEWIIRIARINAAVARSRLGDGVFLL